MSNMFFVENGKLVIIRDNAFRILVFVSFDTFHKYCPINEFSINLTNKVNIKYIPEYNIFTDSENPNINIKDIPDIKYENIINNINLIKDRIEYTYNLLFTKNKIINNYLNSIMINI